MLVQPFPKTLQGRAGRAALFLVMSAADGTLLETPYFDELLHDPKVVELLAQRVGRNPVLAQLAVRRSESLPELVTGAARKALEAAPKMVPLFPLEEEPLEEVA